MSNILNILCTSEQVRFFYLKLMIAEKPDLPNSHADSARVNFSTLQTASDDSGISFVLFQFSCHIFHVKKLLCLFVCFV